MSLGLETASFSARRGLAFLLWCLHHDCPISSSIYEDACHTGDKEMFLWLVENEYPLSNIMLDTALNADIVDIEFLNWIHEQGYRFSSSVMENAICMGRIDVMEWLEKNGYPIPSRALELACQMGGVEICKWIHSRTHEATPDALNYAVVQDDKETVKWLRSIDTPFTRCTILYAAENADIELLDWMYTKNPGIFEENNKGIYGIVIELGHLKVVKWMRQHNMEWDEVEVFDTMIRWCDVKMLKWYRDNYFMRDVISEFKSINYIKLLFAKTVLSHVTINAEHCNYMKTNQRYQYMFLWVTCQQEKYSMIPSVMVE